MEISEINSRFSIFRNIHQNKKGVIMGTGNSLNEYKRIPDAIHFGVNSVAQHEHREILDYYLIADRNTSQSTYIDRNTNKGKQEILNLKCIKLFGIFKHANTLWKNRDNICLTEQDVLDNSAIKYEIGCRKRGTFPKLVKDLDVYCFGGFQSVIWYALQFALFTGINELYIVGCDLDDTNYGKGKPNKSSHLFKMWVEAKKFIEKEYTNVKVIIVNPRRLAALFPNHIYTQI